MPAERTTRTQAQRRSETQHALLTAAVASLAEKGYGGTSTTEVARRAGVSRGAQTHHFPTKAELVVAAVEHVFATQEALFTESFAELPVADRRLDRAVDLLWDIICGDSYQAVLELVVAARTDPELQVVVHAVSAQFEQAVAQLLAELFPEVAQAPHAATLVSFAFATLQGAAISEYAGFGSSDAAVALLRALAGLPLPVLLPLLELP